MTKNTIALFLISILFACDKKSDIPETATSGTVKIAFDESFKSIIQQETTIFQYLYKQAFVKDTVLPQELAHQYLLKDSVKLIFSSRFLNNYENSYFKSRNVFPKTYVFASYGLVILLNKNAKDSTYELSKLKDKFLNIGKPAVLVVDDSKGSALFLIVQLLGLQRNQLENVYSAGSQSDVINYVSENEEAIGILPGTLISDAESPAVQALRKKVRIAKVSASKNLPFYYPFQSEIADSLYPLINKIYIISRESKMGTANGFASFLLGEKGQRIVLKAGLVPARMPGREVVLTKKDIR
ncbi:MAG: substrate-binding domain-containing protein [Opitutaceae bacterium]|nr:substrate-binding domain-containing protein [Cytophagales bacterium]